MPTIKKDPKMVTQINVFTTTLENQDKLIKGLLAAANSVKDIDGWMSASIHKSLDGTKVVNYAQARDQESLNRIIAQLKANGFLDGNHTFGEAHPGVYTVAETLEK
jgi:ABC-type transporter Mla subunit MlaD